MTLEGKRARSLLTQIIEMGLSYKTKGPVLEKSIGGKTIKGGRRRGKGVRIM